MQAKREYRRRDATEVAVLDALVDRREEGMTVLDLRAHVDADIDDLEEALGSLKGDGLIEADASGERTYIYPADRAVPDGSPEHASEDPSLAERLREWIPL
jgi:predicted transcriptional regulator